MATNNPGLQVNAFQALNSYAALAAQINNVLSTIATLKQAEAAHAYSVIYANTATYAVNPDGSPGAAGFFAESISSNVWSVYFRESSGWVCWLRRERSL